MIVHDITLKRYAAGERLALDVSPDAGANECACILSRESWPAGACASVVMRADIGNGQEIVLQSLDISGGDAPLDELQVDMERLGRRAADITAARTELARRWSRSITGWRWADCKSIERDQDGKPAYRERGTEKMREVQMVIDDEGREREIAWNRRRPTSIRIDIEFLQQLNASIRVEVL